MVTADELDDPAAWGCAAIDSHWYNRKRALVLGRIDPSDPRGYRILPERECVFFWLGDAVIDAEGRRWASALELCAHYGAMHPEYDADRETALMTARQGCPLGWRDVAAAAPAGVA